MSEPAEHPARWEQWVQGAVFGAALLILVAVLVASTVVQHNRAERLQAALSPTAVPDPGGPSAYPAPSQRPAYPVPETSLPGASP